MTTLFGNRTRVRRTENGKITWNNTESHTRLCYCVSIFLSRGTHSIETKSDGTFCFIALRNSIKLQLSHGERKRLSFLCFFIFIVFFPSIQWSFNLLRNVIELCWHLPFWKCALVNDEWEVSVASVMYYLFTFIQSFFFFMTFEFSFSIFISDQVFAPDIWRHWLRDLLDTIFK